jgi:hypothetical protein
VVKNSIQKCRLFTIAWFNDEHPTGINNKKAKKASEMTYEKRIDYAKSRHYVMDFAGAGLNFISIK